MIDRRALIDRHRIEVDGSDQRAPLSVGNGEHCITLDVTGTQTVPEHYPVADPAGGRAGTLLGTFTQWAWHATPRPAGADLGAFTRDYPTDRGSVPYVDAPPMSRDDSDLDPALLWLRSNPHRLHLYRIGWVLADGAGPPQSGRLRRPQVDEIVGTQELDLWTGAVTSRARLAGHQVRVSTACHPDRDAVAWVAELPAQTLAIEIELPYGSEGWSGGADWDRPGAHQTRVRPAGGGTEVVRWFDGVPHHRLMLWHGRELEVRQVEEHRIVLVQTGTRIELVIEPVALGRSTGDPLTAAAVVTAAAEHWPRFWYTGAALDLHESTDPRAGELERRAVLSQYLTAIHGAGSTPPAETGLMVNSWRGRFHLEMHYWHAAHFPLWGRPELLERSMPWYHRILDVARATAWQQGYTGARWPKQVAPDGVESPSNIGPFLLWQQPHLIHLAELLRRAGSSEAVHLHAELVLESAAFMADVVVPGSAGYGLGPPLVPAQESDADRREQLCDPPFELAYWRWGLHVANQWRERLGLPADPRWAEVAARMRPPHEHDGCYTALGVPPWTTRSDHPAHVYALGVVPDTGYVDHATMRRTLHDVLNDWNWESTWGWDHPALAMTAARLGEPSLAVDLLLADHAKNTYLVNGHNWQTETLPAYLPGNGGLLIALAMMVKGWDGTDVQTPGFPADGSWVIRHEGLIRSV
ncbi:hypothetical protein [Ruania halotolerans]|uniref:hypothetical protein n=1 Tax=Ruania halotolerans TaxID=2897773 RepID=UPI001E42D440|nr:hypothetical protein [Ruania halotolerans]UFU07198.1 hypothetical protein LQF10_03555 [Ruania halotolerans]